MRILRLGLLVLLFLLSWTLISGQSVITTGQVLNSIQSTVPFLTITPDARSAALGNSGVAISPDINSQFRNPAQYAFIERRAGVSISYSPWMRKLINDMNLYYLAGYYKLNERHAISASVRYFSLGRIVFTSISGQIRGQYDPSEFYTDLAYSRKFSENISLAVAARFICSDLTSGIIGGWQEKGLALSGDLALYYRKDLSLFGRNSQLASGFNISNVGNKIKYADDGPKVFIPINLRAGAAYLIKNRDNNSITFSVDMNKLLIPAPPEYQPGSSGGQGTLRTVLREELHEIRYAFGAEYCLHNKLSFRTGYFHEHPSIGNRKYFTAGGGLNYQRCQFDISGLIPTKENSPLAGTFRFSLGVKFGQSFLHGQTSGEDKN